MQFWCAARNVPWDWSWRPIPGVWLFIALFAWGLWRWNRAGALKAGARVQPLHPLCVVGLMVLWLALDWPIGALGGGYLASAHMLQFLLMGMIAPPLILRGLSANALALLTTGKRWTRVVDRLTAPLLALVLFNVVVLLTHLPAVVDALMPWQLGSFAIDMLWIAAGLAFWWPVVLPVPARPRFPPPLRIGYLILGLMFSPVMFGLVAFLVYSTTPLYAMFELAPPLPGVSSMVDHQLAGVVMSVGGAIVAFTGLTVIFFRWSRESA